MTIKLKSLEVEISWSWQKCAKKLRRLTSVNIFDETVVCPSRKSMQIKIWLLDIRYKN